MMHYICIEDGQITGIMPYEPAVPETITVVEITDEEKTGIHNNTHYFDFVDMVVKSREQSELDIEAAKEAQRIANAQQRFFLESTDWKVLRHIRETALNQPTTLSQEEYIALEQSRADAAAAIVQIQ